MRWTLLALVLVLVLPSCTTLTAAGAKVRLVGGDSGQGDAGSVSGCRDLGPIKAHATSTRPGSPLTGNFAVARSNARNDARNKAAQAGADTLVDLKTEDDMFGVTATGEAYDCGTKQAPDTGEHDGG